MLNMNPRAATLIRVAALALIGWSVIHARHGPGLTGRGLVVMLSFALAAAAWVAWIGRTWKGGFPSLEGGLGELWPMALAGAVLTAASPSSAGSAFVFVAVVAAALRAELRRAFRIAVAGALVLALAELAYRGSALGTLAYALGFAATMLAASNSRSTALRAEQAELLLAQSQRSHEEQLRVAKLEESTRIAREIHDVLAHTLAGLAIQLEATASLIEHGAESNSVLARVRRAHELARDGLAETRRAVGALRGEPAPARPPLTARLEALAAAHRAGGAALELIVDGDPAGLSPEACDAILRVAQEALTNAQKHARGAAVEVRFDAGANPRDQIRLLVTNGRLPGASSASSLASSGAGYGIAGMRERAEEQGGTLVAGASNDGWRVELVLPAARVRAAEAEAPP